MTLKRNLLSFVISFLALASFSQEGEVIDGIKAKLKSHKQNDSAKVELIIDLAWEYSFYDYRNAIRQCDEAIALAKTINYENGIATALNVKGNSYRALTKYDSAFYFLNQSLAIRKKQNRKNKIAAVMQNIGNVYNQQGKIADAISTYKEAIKIAEESGDQQAIMVASNNLSNMYRSAGMTKKAIEALNKAFEINKVLKDSVQEGYLYSTLATLQADNGNIAEAVKYALRSFEIAKSRKDYLQEATLKNNLGMYYRDMGDVKKSMACYQDAIELYSNVEDSLSMALVYNNFATACMANNQLEMAMQSSLKSLRIAKQYEDTVLTYNSLLTIADIYARENNFVKALQNYIEAKPLVEAINRKEDLKEMYQSFSDMYFRKKDYKNASENMLKLLAYTDSINAENNIQLSTTLGIEMELNSKENQIALLSKNAEIKESELKRQKNIRLFFAGIAVLFAFIGVVILFSYRKIKKSNIIINEQKENLEIKNKEVIAQKELVEEKQKEIIDSINYAKRIQTAVLTGVDIWTKVSAEHFILFKPKDIVSGDFYWAYNTPNGRAIFALADCTGHGVPGGFMSMLGNSFLNEIVVEDKIFKADVILNKLRDKIIAALDQEGKSEQKDGMDISLCVWNKIDNTLEFAGANNPLWILKKTVNSNGIENNEIVEYKADKMPIGSHTENDPPFSSQTIQLHKGDIIYMITDGYADQFGGPKGKKFKYKPLMDLLLKTSHESMLAQKNVLDQAINEWKQGYEQIDDVSLIGVRVI